MNVGIPAPARAAEACPDGAVVEGRDTRMSPPAGLYRKLLPGERGLLEAHLLRLVPEDRAMRFCGVVNDAHVHAYCHVADRYRLTIGYFDDGELRAAGEIAFQESPTWHGGCEVALSVEQAYQQQGIGTELMRRLMTLAQNRGATPLEMLCLRANRKIQALARKFDAELVTVGGEVEARLYPRPANHVSLMEESWRDGYAVFGLLFGLGRRHLHGGAPRDARH